MARRVVYLSWPAREISGGIKAAFQHVEMLREAGIDALVATDDGASPTWFESSAPVVSLDAVGVDDDVLVFPENNVALFERFAASKQPKLVFCQNPFQMHRGLAGRASFADWGVSAVLAPSHSVIHFCRRRLPGMRLAYTPFCVDHTRFVFQPRKGLQIAAVPRKRTLEFGAIVDFFRAVYPQFKDVRWVALQAATESQVAQVMGESAVFLSLARLEAHGMTALEAMASGCVVAGFAGVASGTDSATVRNGFWAAEDDVEACADQLARAVRLVIDGGAAHEAMVAEARKTAWDYRREESGRLLVGFLREWLAALPAAA